MFKKTMSFLLAVVMLFGTLTLTSFAAEDVTVSLRIEGIDKCFFYGDVTVPVEATVYDVLCKADEADDSLTVVCEAGAWGAFITSVNGVVAGAYTDKGWDGWSYMVDGVSPEVGISACKVKGGNAVVVYYGDPWNTGMQYPVVKADDLKNGKFSFTSMDTVYDENWNPVTKEVPVTGYVLTWGYGGKTVEITPDENGVCTIPAKYLTPGKHTVQVEKYDAATKLPTVLRFAPDCTVSVRLLDSIWMFLKSIAQAIIALFA